MQRGEPGAWADRSTGFPRWDSQQGGHTRGRSSDDDWDSPRGRQGGTWRQSGDDGNDTVRCGSDTRSWLPLRASDRPAPADGDHEVPQQQRRSSSVDVVQQGARIHQGPPRGPGVAILRPAKAGDAINEAKGQPDTATDRGAPA